jgi:hypothetical protein
LNFGYIETTIIQKEAPTQLISALLLQPVFIQINQTAVGTRFFLSFLFRKKQKTYRN